MLDLTDCHPDGIFKHIFGRCEVRVLTGLVFLFLTVSCSYLPQGFGALTGVTVTEDRDGIYLLSGDSPAAGLIFYPGGLVDPHAYIPLLSRLVTNGYAAFIVKAPLNLQVLAAGAADQIRSSYPGITAWFIGGHSLGGAMGAKYFYDNQTDLAGLYLLAAWPTQSWDLSASQAGILLLSGSVDGVATPQEVQENLAYLPALRTLGGSGEVLTNTACTFWYEIPGGNHSQFGAYGDQEGDGTALITRESQLDITAALILDYVQGRGY